MRNSALCRPPFASFLCQSLTDDSSSSTHAESGPASLKFHPKHCLTTDRERERKKSDADELASAPGRAESQRAGNGTASPPWRGQLCMHSDSAATSECPVSPPIQPAQRSWISPLLLRGAGTTRGPIEDTLHAARTQYIHRTRARHAAGELVARGLIMRSGDEG
jgi:hypothetical protein